MAKNTQVPINPKGEFRSLHDSEKDNVYAKFPPEDNQNCIYYERSYPYKRKIKVIEKDKNGKDKKDAQGNPVYKKDKNGYFVYLKDDNGLNVYDEKENIGRVFSLATAKKLHKLINNTPKHLRAYCEISVSEQPDGSSKVSFSIKPFWAFDQTKKLKYYEDKDYEDSFAEFYDVMFAEINKRLPNEYLDEDYIEEMNAHTKLKKMFRGVLCGFDFDDIWKLKEFMLGIFDKLKHPLSKYFDRKVYTPNTAFSVPPCCKIGENNHLRLGMWEEEVKDISLEDFKRCLITYIPEDSITIPSDGIPDTKNEKGQKTYSDKNNKETNRYDNFEINTIDSDKLLDLLRLTDMDMAESNENTGFDYRYKLAFAVRKVAPDKYEEIQKTFFQECKWNKGKNNWSHLDKIGGAANYDPDNSPGLAYIIKNAKKYQENLKKGEDIDNFVKQYVKIAYPGKFNRDDPQTYSNFEVQIAGQTILSEDMPEQIKKGIRSIRWISGSGVEKFVTKSLDDGDVVLNFVDETPGKTTYFKELKYVEKKTFVKGHSHPNITIVEEIKEWCLRDWINKQLKPYIRCEEMQFYPHNDTEESPPGIFNTFLGFRARRLPKGVNPNKYYINIYKNYVIKIAANGNKKLGYYLIKVKADMLQNPRNPKKTLIVSHAEGGSGNSTVDIKFGENIIGKQHYGLVSDLAEVCGKYNMAVLDKIFVLIDDFKIESNDEVQLMNAITHSTRTYNNKYGLILRNRSNYTRYAATTENEPRVNMARRCVYAKVSNKYALETCRGKDEEMKDRTKYFNELFNGALTKGADDIYTWLMNIDLTDWDPEDFPSSCAYKDVDNNNKTLPLKFLDDWNWTTEDPECNWKKIDIVHPIKIGVLITEFLQWKHKRFPTNNEDFTTVSIVMEIKKNDDIVISKAQNQNMYYSKTIDKKRAKLVEADDSEGIIEMLEEVPAKRTY